MSLSRRPRESEHRVLPTIRGEPSGFGAAVFTQDAFEGSHRVAYLTHLALQKTTDFGRQILTEYARVLNAGGLGIFAAPLDDSAVTHTHRSVEIHRRAIDETRHAA